MKLPKRVTICEVGTRDGFQIEPEFVPTDQKIEVVNQLSATGMPRIEVTSFVSPKAVPMLKDAEAVMARLRQENVVVTVRAGRIRIAAHFYNLEEELDRVAELIASLERADDAI